MPQQAVRFPDDLHSAIKAEADRRGKPHTFSSVLIEWASVGRKAADERQLYEILREAPDWEAPDGALEAVLSEAKGAASTEQSGPVPVPLSESDGVRPAAQPRTHGDAAHAEICKQIAQRHLTTPPGLRSNGHLPSCKCWRCVKLDGAA